MLYQLHNNRTAQMKTNRNPWQSKIRMELTVALLILVALICLWIRSFTNNDQVGVAIKSTTGLTISSSGGSIFTYANHDLPSPMPLVTGVRSERLVPGTISLAQQALGRFSHRFRGDLRGFSFRLVFPFWLPVALWTSVSAWFIMRRKPKSPLFDR